MATSLTLNNNVPKATAEFTIKQGPSEFQYVSVAGDGGQGFQATDPTYATWEIYAAIKGQTSPTVTVKDPNATITSSLSDGKLVLTVGAAPEEEDPAPAPAPCGGGSSSTESFSHQEILDYWTVARKSNAVPKLGFAQTTKQMTDKFQNGKSKIEELPTAGPTTTLVSNLTVAPYAAVGKLFFHWEGQDYVGSAWIFLTSSGKRVIFTAGHNLFDKGAGSTGTWSSKVVFQLQYNDTAFVAEWTGTTLHVPPQWLASTTDYAYDLAIVGTKDPIASSTPALAYSVASAPVASSYRAIGYPARPIPNFNFNGKYMWESVGDMVATSGGCFSAYNNMTQGSSGGPWVVKVSGTWHANGVQSHRLSDPDMALSPIFTAAKIDALLLQAGASDPKKS